jgi:group I intron endonuclease
MKQINKNLKQKCGVYIITNLVNSKKYIGSSKDLFTRLNKHRLELEKGTHVNKHLQSSFSKHGIDNFEYGILCVCEENVQYINEQYYIDIIKPEYNIAIDVINSTKTEEVKSKISNSIKNKYLENPDFNRKHKDNLYLYDVESWKLIKIGKLSELCNYLYNNSSSLKVYQIDSGLIKDKYVVCSKKFKFLEELKNFIYENVLKYKTSDNSLKYLIIESDDEIFYFRTTQKAVDFMKCSSASTLKKHSANTKENPYIIPNSVFKMYMSTSYIPIKINEAVLVEESLG